ncbi:MAG: hypothetical protein COA52_02300 [Hyphomicrobiales bacterium]|nr:hypothetical protein [Hyphomicrobiales bacterium]PCJ96170.1 MAG: hypothetical protein COA52_02300 [Hyphomicrobiales bacterium]
MHNNWLQENSFDEEDFSLAERQQTAINVIEAAWEEATEHGVEDEILVNTSLFAALSKLVMLYGEDATAEYCRKLSTRVDNGEFTLFRVLN